MPGSENRSSETWKLIDQMCQLWSRIRGFSSRVERSLPFNSEKGTDCRNTRESLQAQKTGENRASSSLASPGEQRSSWLLRPGGPQDDRSAGIRLYGLAPKNCKSQHQDHGSGWVVRAPVVCINNCAVATDRARSAYFWSRNGAKRDSVKLKDLIPDERNANKGSERGQQLLENSLRKCGAGRSILIDKNGRIIAGNKTAENAGSIGLDDVIVVQSDGTKLVAVQRTDLDLTKDKAAKDLAIFDNRSSEVSLSWDVDVLKELDAEIDLKEFWTEAELDILLGSVVPSELLGDEDSVPEVPDEPITKPGDLYTLGRHRVICGDSTVSTDIDKLLAGVSPHLMVTDPPYGVEYDPNWRNEAERPDGSKYGASAVGKVSNDDKADWREAWDLFPGDVAYVWHAGIFAGTVADSLQAAGFQIRAQIVWAKPRFAISRGHYHWQHEPCWYAVRKGGTGHWSGDRSQTTLWEMAHNKSETGHGTQKPVEAMRRPIQNNSSPGQAVYDPFLGSGTTLIACETEGRICYGMELDPKYVDVILNRWSELTGKDPVREDGVAWSALKAGASAF